jgi:hypothetical protein
MDAARRVADRLGMRSHIHFDARSTLRTMPPYPVVVVSIVLLLIVALAGVLLNLRWD